jgi:hypothetical protein
MQKGNALVSLCKPPWSYAAERYVGSLLTVSQEMLQGTLQGHWQGNHCHK